MTPSISIQWRKFVHSFKNLGNHEALGKLGDFTTSPRVILISLMAIVIGIISAFVALILLRLIGLFTNLFFFQRWGTALVSPAGNHLGLFVVLVPILGALVIGVMARFGSERIRGHGIPEAIEAILINGSKVEPKVAILKPLSSALSIGTGGPFGAEGPIIMTGGAFGSLIAQFFHLSSAERKTLLVAGAAGGMSATFASPVAAVMLAVELLLFEWKPRSLIPVALASATALVVRRYIIGLGPLFPTPPHPTFIGPVGVLGCVLVGLLAGGLSALLTIAVYASEDAFRRLPIHWMWWPAIGGLVIGIGGLIFPQALGVGYDVIGQLLQGNASIQLIVGVLLVKSIIWSVSLGSGTSGGVLAPLLMMGGALGGLESLFLPHLGGGFWELVSMAAILGGTMRSPFTGIIFTLELTHDINMLLPLMVACVVAHGFTVIVMRRSILTEKVSRRGYHLSREYAVDPLEIIFVREVMRTSIVALPDTISRKELVNLLENTQQRNHQLQRLYPVVDAEQLMKGVVTRTDLQVLQQRLAAETVGPDGQSEHDGHDGHDKVLVNHETGHDDGELLPKMLHKQPTVAYPDEPLRSVVYRMAETGHTRLPVVERNNPRKLVGLVSLYDLLKARTRNLEEERRRERVLRLRLLFAARGENESESESEERVK
ncbi:MAG TPA: chloride channel protein [Ktedonobacteraceae bacterium]|nr:chloride channel protein [Ktedonobacteraceae bacterium]